MPNEESVPPANKTSNKVFFFLLSSMIFPFMLLVVAPFSFYFGNREEISFSLTEIAIPILIIFSGLAIIIFIFLFLIRNYKTLLNVSLGVITAAAAAIWVQSQLFAWKFGLLNGQKIDWGNWKMHIGLEGIVWILILVLSILLMKKNKLRNNILFALYLIGVFSIITSILSSPKTDNTPIEIFNKDEIFNFHPQKNVLVVVLDTYQSDYFEYIINNFPKEIKEFDGFTFYRNTISKYPLTRASLPSIITGSLYKNDTAFNIFHREAQKKYTLMSAYEKIGYNTLIVGLKGHAPKLKPMDAIVKSLAIDFVHPFFNYADFALFRSSPTFIKPFIYNNGNWLLSFQGREKYPPDRFRTDKKFLELFEEYAFIDKYFDYKGAFKFLHFYIPHAPWVVDKNFQYNSKAEGISAYIDQVRGATLLVTRILTTLKKIGVYNNTEIVIMSDHGTMQMPIATKKETFKDALAEVQTRVQTSSHALLLHKPIGSKGEIITNNTPLEICDLACLLGVAKSEKDCINFAKAMAGEEINRTFYFYELQPNGWKTEYFPDMVEYNITGDVSDILNYKKGSFTYTRNGLVKNNLPNRFYHPGDIISFAADGNAKEYMLNGWSPQERSHIWTTGHYTGMQLQFTTKPQKDMIIQVWGRGLSDCKRVIHQNVKVYANGVQIAIWDLNKNKDYIAKIPNTLFEDNKLNIVFKIDNVSKDEDQRRIGMAFFKLVISEP